MGASARALQIKSMDVEHNFDAAQVLKTLPDVTKILLVLLACGAGFNIIGFGKYLMMVPNSTVGDFHIWTLVTYAFVEKGLVQMVLSLVTISTVGRIAEPMWGSAEFALFIGVVVLTSAIASWITCLLRSNCLQGTRMLVDSGPSGCRAYFS